MRRVAETMIPFALNANRVPENEGGKFFKAVLRKQDWPQGLWIVAADGRILAFHYYRTKPGETFAAGQERWVHETRAFVEAGLQEFGPVERRRPQTTDPLKHRGVGVLADGGVRLAIYAHGMRKGEKDGEPVVDSALLTKNDWADFLPKQFEVGSTWSVPAPVLGKLAPVLSPLTDVIFTPQPRDMTKAELVGTVEHICGGTAYIRWTGQLESQHLRDNDPKYPIRANARLEGLAQVTVATRHMRRLLLVTDGVYRRSTTPQILGGVIDWRAE